MNDALETVELKPLTPKAEINVKTFGQTWLVHERYDEINWFTPKTGWARLRPVDSDSQFDMIWVNLDNDENYEVVT